MQILSVNKVSILCIRDCFQTCMRLLFWTVKYPHSENNCLSYAVKEVVWAISSPNLRNVGSVFSSSEQTRKMR